MPTASPAVTFTVPLKLPAVRVPPLFARVPLKSAVPAAFVVLPPMLKLALLSTRLLSGVVMVNTGAGAPTVRISAVAVEFANDSV